MAYAQPMQSMQQNSMQQQNDYAQQKQQQKQQQKVQTQKNSQNENVQGQGGMQIVRQGWMMKKGDIIKNWKKRYFVLQSNRVLNYYESSSSAMVKGTVALRKATRVVKKSTQSLEVHTPKRKWCFACKDTATRDEWVRVIKAVAQI